MFRKIFCKLGFHKFYCKTYEDQGRITFNGKFECKYCKKAVSGYPLYVI